MVIRSVQKDVEGIIYEAGKLNEELERLQNEKEANDSLAQAKSQQCEILSKKVSTLVTELEEVKSEVLEKQRLLEAKEQENLKLASFLQELQHKLVTEVHILPLPQDFSRFSPTLAVRDLKLYPQSFYNIYH